MTDKKPAAAVERSAVACTLADKPLMPAQEGMCRECPLRKANYESTEREPFYHRKSAMHSWRAIREGNFHACHMFDEDAYRMTDEQKQSGLFHEPVDIGANRECAGAVIAAVREIELALSYPTYEAYIKDRPGGVSPEAIAIAVARQEGRTQPPLNVPKGVDAEEVISPLDHFPNISLTDTLPRSVIAEVLSMTPGPPESCKCFTCQGHAGIHQTRKLTTAQGEIASVDEEMWPLLDRLAGAGIHTTHSCKSLTDAMGTLDPSRLEELRIGDQPLHFRNIIAGDLAYIRLYSQTRRERAFVEEASRVPDVTVQTSGPFAQIEYSLESSMDLMAAVNRVTLLNREPSERGK